MIAYNKQTPILLLVFNRPELIRKVFDCISKAQPKKLNNAADGARYAEEQIICDAVKEIIKN